MSINLKGKHFLRIRDFKPEEISYLVDHAIDIKKNKTFGFDNTNKKHAVCFFSLSSSRTKSAWEVAAFESGMMNSYNDANSSQLGKKESIYDSAKVFSEFYDVIGWRHTNYEDIAELAKYASIPVINLLCDKNHPTQAICDLVTIKEKFGKIKGVKVAFVGACNNNVARSLIEGLLSLGAEYIGIGPKEEFPSKEEMKFYTDLAKKNGGKVSFTTDVNKLKGVNVIYQDVFLNLGESFDLWPAKLEKYKGYQLTEKTAKLADKNYIYMHCLPAINGSSSAYTKHISKTFGKQFPYVKNGEVEVVSKVFYDTKHSVVYEEAVNRVYAIKAIFSSVIKK